MSRSARPLARALALTALSVLGVPGLCAGALGQAQLVPLTQVVRTAPYDAASQSFVQAGLDAGGIGPTMLFDNSDETFVYLSAGVNEIYMDWGRLTGFGENAVTQMVICYGTTSTEPVDVTVRLHSGLEDESAPGAGLALPLTGLPGSFDGSPVAWQIPVLLARPIYLPDGPLRYSLQADDGVTGPALVDPDPGLELSGTLQFFSQLGVANPEFDQGSGGDPFSLFLQLLGVPLAYDHTGLVQAPLTGKDLYHGWLADADDEQTFRLDVLPDETLTLTLSADKGASLVPALAVSRVVGGELLASESSGKSKVAIKKLVISGGGALALTVSAAAGSGGYRLKVASKVAKSSAKPEVDTSGQQQGGLLSSFEAEPCALLSAKVFPSPKSKQVPPRPVLSGPLGEVGADAWLLKGSTWSLKKLALPVHGTYSLRAGSVGEAGEPGVVDLPVSAKLSIKPAKLAASKRDAFADELAGHWVADDFITEVNRFTASFVASKKGSGALLDKQPNPGGSLSQPTLTLTSQLGDWEVLPVDPAPDGERTLEYRISGVDLQPPVFDVTSPSASVVRQYEHPGGDPDVIRFLDDGGALAPIWRRDTLGAPAAPLVQVDEVESPDPGGPSQHILSFAYSPTFRSCQVFKASAGTEIMPARPVAEVEPCPFGPAGAQQMAFTDLSSADGAPASYWVVVVDDEGRRSEPSAVVTVF